MLAGSRGADGCNILRPNTSDHVVGRETTSKNGHTLDKGQLDKDQPPHNHPLCPPAKHTQPQRALRSAGVNAGSEQRNAAFLLAAMAPRTRPSDRRAHDTNTAQSQFVGILWLGIARTGIRPRSLLDRCVVSAGRAQHLGCPLTRDLTAQEITSNQHGPCLDHTTWPPRRSGTLTVAWPPRRSGTLTVADIIDGINCNR